MRKERVVFEQVYSRLEKELGVKRFNMVQLIEEVGDSFEQRDVAAAKLAKLRAAEEQQNDIVEDLHD